jgi:hypothetical protein
MLRTTTTACPARRLATRRGADQGHFSKRRSLPSARRSSAAPTSTRSACDCVVQFGGAGKTIATASTGARHEQSPPLRHVQQRRRAIVDATVGPSSYGRADRARGRTKSPSGPRRWAENGMQGAVHARRAQGNSLTEAPLDDSRRCAVVRCGRSTMTSWIIVVLEVRVRVVERMRQFLGQQHDDTSPRRSAPSDPCGVDRRHGRIGRMPTGCSCPPHGARAPRNRGTVRAGSGEQGERDFRAKRPCPFETARPRARRRAAARERAPGAKQVGEQDPCAPGNAITADGGRGGTSSACGQRVAASVTTGTARNTPVVAELLHQCPPPLSRAVCAGRSRELQQRRLAFAAADTRLRLVDDAEARSGRSSQHEQLARSGCATDMGAG